MREAPIIGIISDKKNIHVTGFPEYGNNCRKSLVINIEHDNDDEKSLIAIMLNPSEYAKNNNKKGIFIDQTVTNLVKIANDNGYTKVMVLNLFTEKQPNSREVNYDVTDEENNKRILEAIETSNDILIAWGSKYVNNTRNSFVKQIIQKLKKRGNVYTFCEKPNPKYPKHPGRINIECCRNCFGRNDCIKLKPYF